MNSCFGVCDFLWVRLNLGVYVGAFAGYVRRDL